MRYRYRWDATLLLLSEFLVTTKSSLWYMEYGRAGWDVSMKGKARTYTVENEIFLKPLCDKNLKSA